MPPRSVSVDKVAMVGTYLPRRCGIATFSSDLHAALADAAPNTEWWSVALNDGAGLRLSSRGPVRDRPEGAVGLPHRGRLPQHERRSTPSASSTSSASMAARPATTSCSRCRTFACRSSPRCTPCSRSPTPTSARSCRRSASLSDRVVVMSQRAKRDPRAGSTASPRRASPSSRTAFPTCRSSIRPTTRTSSASSARRSSSPSACSRAARASNTSSRRCPRSSRRIPTPSSSSSARPIPACKRHEGEAYRDRAAAARAASSASTIIVVFYDQFIDTKTLTEFLSHRRRLRHALPQPRADRLGRAELRPRRRQGDRLDALLVRRGDARRRSRPARSVPRRGGDRRARSSTFSPMTSSGDAMRKRAYTYARDMVWSEVGAQYLRLFREVRRERAIRPRTFQARTLQTTPFELPAAAARSPARPHRRHRHSPARPVRRARPRPRLLHRRQCPRADRCACWRSTSFATVRRCMPLAYRYLGFLQHALQRREPAASATS